MNNFKYIDRNKKKDIILLPGWATDIRVFDNIDIDYNYFLPLDFKPQDFERECLKLLDETSKQNISLYGWSLGGYVAADFTVKHPGLVDELFLVSVKEAYKKESVDKVKGCLDESRKAYLYKFYHECFSENEKEKLKWFKDNLIRDYMEKFDLGILFRDLQYFLDTPIDLKALKDRDVKVIFGMKDKIVPVQEIISLKENLPRAMICFVNNAGHMPF